MRIVLFLCFFMLLQNYKVLALEKKNIGVKKIVKYKKRTSIDLTSTVVQGKVRSPEIFYIFQRKRDEGGKLLAIPEEMYHHHDDTLLLVKEVVGR